MKNFAENKKAYFDYEILDEYEAGIVLVGYEVKSIKTGKASLKGSYVVIRNQEVYLVGANISPYQPKNTPSDYNPDRDRKLLLNKDEIRHLIGKSKEKGFALIPLKFYSKNGNIKLAFGIGKGKKKSDKRETIKKRESDREIKKEIEER
ncbi:MAG: SsrA-binding protein SmpB [Candidatus Nealsonbacteria bacterium]